MESNSSQAALGLAFGVHRAPRPAPEKLVRDLHDTLHADMTARYAEMLRVA